MKATIRLLILCFPFIVLGQTMNNEKLNTIYTTVSDTIEGNSGRWRFMIEDIVFISITDENNNRMRIISPITASENLTDDTIRASLVANFHSALDVKYAVSDGVLWSVFIHPLKELSEEQVKSAISQVFYANKNFGTTYASSSLVFPGSLQNKKNTKKPPSIESGVKKI